MHRGLIVGVALILGGQACTSSDPSSNRTDTRQPPAGLQRIKVGGLVWDLKAGRTGMWVLAQQGNATFLTELDGQSGQLLEEIRIPGPLDGSLAVGQDAVWVASRARRMLYRIDLHTHRVEARHRLPSEPDAVVVGFGSVWIANSQRNLVLRLDRAGNVVERIAVPDGPSALQAGSDAMWVGSLFHGEAVHRIDPGTNRVSLTLADHSLRHVGREGVWVTGNGSPNGRLMRLDPRTERMYGPYYPLEILPATVSEGHSGVWVGRWFEPPGCRDLHLRGLLPCMWGILRLDPQTMRPIGPPLPLPSGPNVAMAERFGALWTPAERYRSVLRLDIAEF